MNASSTPTPIQLDLRRDLPKVREDVEQHGEWQVGAFTIQHSVEEGAKPATVAGWINGLFALDFRPTIPEDDFVTSLEDAPAWVLTHLPTGWAMQGVRGTFEEAKFVAARFEEMADWDFTDPAEAKLRVGDKVALFRRQYGAHLVSPTRTISPWHVVESGIAALARGES